MGNMKDSGIEWIGMIPEEWKFKKLKFLYDIGLGLTHTPEYVDNGIPFISVKDISSGKLDMSQVKYISEEEYKSFPDGAIPHKNDILFGRVATIGCPVILDKDIEIGMFVSIGKLTNKLENEIDNKFMYYWMKSELFVNETNQYIAGSAQLNLNTDWLKKFRVIIPSLYEQQLIVEFLDDKVGKIDDILSDLRKQVGLLQKYKKSVITRAVTKGLDSSVSMKDSGIDWIGEIPEEWEVCRIKDVLNVLTDYTANGSFQSLADNVEYLDYEDYARVIRLTDLRVNMENAGIYVTEDAYKYLSKSALFGNEILVANVGAYAGLFCMMSCVDYKTTLGPNMFLLKTNSKLTHRMLYYLGQSASVNEQLTIKATSSAQPKLNKQDVKTVYIAIPKICEQQQIADYLDDKCAKIDELIKDKEAQIEKMEKYKKSMIYEYVTGKKRVKGV